MTDPQHPDDELDELASAYLDGMASPAERARVAADPVLLARVDALGQVRAAVRSLDLRVDAEAREATIAAALDALTATGPSEPAGADAAPLVTVPAAGPARPPGVASHHRLRYLAVAAAVAAAALAVPLLDRLDSGEDDQSAATLDATSEAASDDAGGGQARDAAESGTTAAGEVPFAADLAASDLGAFDDLAGLAAAARRRVEAPPAVDESAGSAAVDAVTTTSGGACAGSVDVPADATVLVQATATLAGDPVLVVVYATPGADPQLLVVDASDCTTRSLSAL
jgi:hypothetical protein